MKRAAIILVLGAVAASAAPWWTLWAHENAAVLTLGTFNGRDNVYLTRAVDADRRFQWTRTVTPAADISVLSFDIGGATDATDFLLLVMVNGQKAYEQPINGKSWQTIRVELAGGEGQNVPIALVVASKGHPQGACWDRVSIDPPPQR
jgi:hypothetical protein